MCHALNCAPNMCAGAIACASASAFRLGDSVGGTARRAPSYVPGSAPHGVRCSRQEKLSSESLRKNNFLKYKVLKNKFTSNVDTILKNKSNILLISWCTECTHCSTQYTSCISINFLIWLTYFAKLKYLEYFVIQHTNN